MRSPILSNNRGQILTYILAGLFLAYFAATVLLFLMYKEGLFRFEFGLPKTENREMVYDKTRVMELFQREKLLAEETKKLEVTRISMDNLKKEIELEKSKMQTDKDAISKVMQEISDKFKQLSAEEEANLARLAKLYSSMKAQRVAKIFDALDTPTVAQLLNRMKENVSAKILGEIGNIDAERAAEISKVMQGKIKKDVFAKIE